MVKKEVNRRKFLGKLSGGLIVLGLVGQMWAYIRSLVPNVLYEPPKKFKVGHPSEFPEGVTFLEQKRIYIIKEKGGFFAISAVCTHLGCTVKHSPFSTPKEVIVKGEAKTMNWEFRCPCHGSIFHGDGTAFEGPAPRSLAWHPLEVSQDDGQLIVDMAKEVKNDFRLIT